MGAPLFSDGAPKILQGTADSILTALLKTVLPSPPQHAADLTFKALFQSEIALGLGGNIKFIVPFGFAQRPIKLNIFFLAKPFHRGGKLFLDRFGGHREIPGADGEFRIDLRLREPFQKGHRRPFPFLRGAHHAHPGATLHHQRLASVKNGAGIGHQLHLFRGIVAVGHFVGEIENAGGGNHRSDDFPGAQGLRGVAVLEPEAAL